MTDQEEADELDRALRALPSSDVDPSRKERIRGAAHRALERGTPSAFALLYDRVLEPTLVVGVSVVYLVWAFGRAAAVLLGG